MNGRIEVVMIVGGSVSNGDGASMCYLLFVEGGSGKDCLLIPHVITIPVQNICMDVQEFFNIILKVGRLIQNSTPAGCWLPII